MTYLLEDQKKGPLDRGKNRVLNAAAGFFISIFGRGKDDKKLEIGADEHRTSTQAMGIRFSERIRDAFRFRWVKGR